MIFIKIRFNNKKSFNEWNKENSEWKIVQRKWYALHSMR